LPLFVIVKVLAKFVACFTVIKLTQRVSYIFCTNKLLLNRTEKQIYSLPISITYIIFTLKIIIAEWKEICKRSY